ncbi:MAG TPA: hypothetical protein VLH61_12265, partial [Bacteroidales bacterium]|nr:hypothetical protein [Bacteroidales bacterium]
MQENDFKQLLTEGAILTFDKPLGWTSFDVVNKVRLLIRHILGIKKLKAGHAGTLDPLATGLLIICTGAKTKNIEQFQDFEKEYTGTFTIGQTTPSFDLETIPDASFPLSHITYQMALEAAKKLSGYQKQIPPLFSAKKIDGRRAYEMARR